MGYIWIIYGLYMDYIWIIYGLSMDYIWIIYGLYGLHGFIYGYYEDRWELQDHLEDSAKRMTLLISGLFRKVAWNDQETGM